MAPDLPAFTASGLMIENVFSRAIVLLPFLLIFAKHRRSALDERRVRRAMEGSVLVGAVGVAEDPGARGVDEALRRRERLDGVPVERDLLRPAVDGAVDRHVAGERVLAELARVPERHAGPVDLVAGG